MFDPKPFDANEPVDEIETSDAYGWFRYEEEVVVFDRDAADRWIVSDTTIELSEAA